MFMHMDKQIGHTHVHVYTGICIHVYTYTCCKLRYDVDTCNIVYAIHVATKAIPPLKLIHCTCCLPLALYMYIHD